MFEYRSPKCVNIGDLSFTLVSMAFVIPPPPMSKKTGVSVIPYKDKNLQKKDNWETKNNKQTTTAKLR